jgi:hypothetical protein
VPDVNDIEQMNFDHALLNSIADPKSSQNFINGIKTRQFVIQDYDQHFQPSKASVHTEAMMDQLLANYTTVPTASQKVFSLYSNSNDTTTQH